MHLQSVRMLSKFVRVEEVVCVKKNVCSRGVIFSLRNEGVVKIL